MICFFANQLYLPMFIRYSCLIKDVCYHSFDILTFFVIVFVRKLFAYHIPNQGSVLKDIGPACW